MCAIGQGCTHQHSGHVHFPQESGKVHGADEMAAVWICKLSGGGHTRQWERHEQTGSDLAGGQGLLFRQRF